MCVCGGGGGRMWGGGVGRQEAGGGKGESGGQHGMYQGLHVCPSLTFGSHKHLQGNGVDVVAVIDW
jgi:hypothetical protein